MLKTLWDYQKLLMNALGFRIIKSQRNSAFLRLFIPIAISEILFTLTDRTVIFFPTTIALYLIYFIITSENRFFEIVPVSKKYTIFNIYLLVLLISISITAALLVLYLLLSLFENFGFNTDTYIAIHTSIIDYKISFQIVCIMVIIANIIIPLFFIRLKQLRIILLIFLIVFATIIFFSITTSLAVTPDSININLFQGIKTIPISGSISMLLMITSVVIIPLSMLISYRIYRGKRCKT